MIIHVIGTVSEHDTHAALNKLHALYPVTGIVSEHTAALEWFFAYVDMIHVQPPESQVQYIVALPGAVIPDTTLTVWEPYK